MQNEAPMQMQSTTGLDRQAKRSYNIVIVDNKERTMQDISTIVAQARAIAEQESQRYFQQRLQGRDQMMCGFAWVDVYVDRTNSKTAKELIRAGFRKDYKPKCLSMWNPGGLGIQNIDAKEAGAQAMARFLQQQGFEAYAGSRLD